MSNFTPKRVAERTVLGVDYSTSNEYVPTDPIVTAVWSNSVAIGADPSPNAMIDGAAQINGSLVLQSVINGVSGCTYVPICTGTTASGKVIILPDPGVGFLQVV